MKIGILITMLLLASCSNFNEFSHPAYQDSGCINGAGDRMLVPMTLVHRIERGEAEHCRMILTDTLMQTVELCMKMGSPSTSVGCWNPHFRIGVAPKDCEATIIHEQAHCLGWRH